MNIDIPDTTPEQSVAIDEMPNFRIRGDHGVRQIRQGIQHYLSLTQIAQGEFTNNKRMCQSHSGAEHIRKLLFARAEVVHPNGRINQDHAGVARRRGGASRPGSLAPSRASRRALSRSMSAFNASRTRLDFSRRPVKA